jgi:hypothetical protein
MEASPKYRSVVRNVPRPTPNAFEDTLRGSNLQVVYFVGINYLFPATSLNGLA